MEAEALKILTQQLIDVLKLVLPKISSDWWRLLVIEKLTFDQQRFARKYQPDSLEQFDLAALLRIAEQNWNILSEFYSFETIVRTWLKEAQHIRNTLAHASVDGIDDETCYRYVDTIERLLKAFETSQDKLAIVSNQKKVLFNKLASPASPINTKAKSLPSQSPLAKAKLRVNTKPFLTKNFPEFLKYKITASRMYEKNEKKNYLDNWWFNFSEDNLKSNEFIILVGALDYENKNFRVFKVPTAFLLKNFDKIDSDKNGWINLYIHSVDLIDLRNSNNLSFREFAIN